MDGSGSHDQEDDSLQYKWSLLSYPEGGYTNISDSTKAKSTLKIKQSGDYNILLRVNDGYFADRDTVLLHAIPSIVSGHIDYFTGAVKNWDETALNITTTNSSHTVAVDISGNFHYGLRIGTPTTITALKKFTNPDRTEVSVADVLKLQRVLLDLDPKLDEDYRYVADMNDDHTIDLKDAIIIDQLIVGRANADTLGMWHFIPERFRDQFPANELNKVTFTLQKPDSVHVNFKAYLKGDVNGSWGAKQPKNKTKGKTHPQTFTLQSGEQDTLSIELALQASQPIAGFELPLWFNDKNLKLLGITNRKLPHMKPIFGVQSTEHKGAEVSMVWHNLQQPVHVQKQQRVLNLKFLKKRSKANYMFKMGSSLEFANTQAKVIHADVKLTISNPEDQQELPEKTRLVGAFPNPFNPSTNIKYELKKDAQVRLTVYNVLGRRIAVLVDGKKKAGSYQERWDAGKVSSGLYIVRLQTPTQSFVQTITLIK